MASRLLSEGGYFSNVPILDVAISRFMVQATIIIGVCRALSLLGSYLKQPRVIFEIIGGILLGPSALGRDERYLVNIFPTASLSGLSLVANIGLVLYLFLVGLELDPKLLMTHARKAGSIAVMGMAVPFCLGIAISRVMFDTLQGSDPHFKHVKFTSFFVFIGTAMSITAFPVLARILKEGGLIYTKAGSMAMGAAALNDALAWCLLMLAFSIANSGNMKVAGYVFGCLVALAVGLFVVIRPIFEFVVRHVESWHNKAMNSNLFALTIILLFCSAWTTQLLGVDAIFGAFLFGLIVPRDSHLFKECIVCMEELVVTLTLPLYFALSGLKTDVTTISTKEEGAITVLVCVVATVGKFVGAGGTAYLSGLGVRESSSVAILMNARGLVELIVLNLGVSSKILNTRTFTVMVIMCLFTTFITCPLIELVYPAKYRTNATAETALIRSKKGKSAVIAQEDAADSSFDVNDVIYPDLSNLSKTVNVGLVVDNLEHLEVLIKVISCFVPNSKDTQLAVTALHFIEPSCTTEDEFLGLNEEGRLILVSEETTTMSSAIRMMEEDPTMKKPELLPLSLFCRTVGCPVSAYRIQGDPDEFPVELQQITKLSENDLVIIPWRNSIYARKLFWSSLHLLSVPFILVAQSDQKSIAQGDQVRNNRSGTLFSFGNFLGTDFNVDSAHDHTQTDHDSSTAGIQMHSVRSNTLNTNLGSNAHVLTRRNSFKPVVISKLNSTPRALTHILAIMTGLPMDVALLYLIIRFSESASNLITVLVPADYNKFDPFIKEAMSEFRKYADATENITLRNLETSSSEIDELVQYTQDLTYDILICSFMRPQINTSNAAAVDRDIETAGNAAPSSSVGTASLPSSGLSHRRRSSTLDVIAEVLTGTSRVNEESAVTEMNTQAGVPEDLMLPGVTYPELGVLGSQIFSYHVTTNPEKIAIFLILHESDLMTRARLSTKRTPVQNPISQFIDRLSRGSMELRATIQGYRGALDRDLHSIVETEEHQV